MLGLVRTWMGYRLGTLGAVVIFSLNLKVKAALIQQQHQNKILANTPREEPVAAKGNPANLFNANSSMLMSFSLCL